MPGYDGRRLLGLLIPYLFLGSHHLMAQAVEPAKPGILETVVRGHILSAGVFGGKVWFSTEDGTFQLAGGEPTSYFAQPARAMAEHKKEVWVATGTGLSVVDTEGRIVSLSNEDLRIKRKGPPKISAIEAAFGSVWIGTDEALFRIDETSGNYVTKKVLSGPVTGLKLAGEHLWLVKGEKNDEIFVSSSGDSDSFGFIQLLPQDIKVNRISTVNEIVWVTTSKHVGPSAPFTAYPFRGDGQPTSAPLSHFRGITYVSEVENRALFGSTDGVFEIDQAGTLKPIFHTESPVSSIFSPDGECWVATTGDGLFRSRITDEMATHIIDATAPSIVHEAKPSQGDIAAFKPVPRTIRIRKTPTINGLFESEGRVWAYGEVGLQRFEPKSSIEFTSSIVNFWGINLILEKFFRIKEVGYTDARRDGALKIDDDARFLVYLGRSSSQLDDAIANTAHSSPYAGYLPVESGFHDIHVAIEDHNGNSIRRTYNSVLHIHPVVWSLITPLLGSGIVILWVVSSVSVLAARRFLFGMAIVDSRFFRTRVSCGCLPFMFLSMSVRRHILGRYRDHLTPSRSHLWRSLFRLKWRVLTPNKTGAYSFVSESTEKIVTRLSDSPLLFVTGTSSDRKEIFVKLRRDLACYAAHEYLEGSYASLTGPDHKRIAKSRGRVGLSVPIYFQLRTYLTTECEDPHLNDLIEGVCNELANYGDINDRDLVKYLLDFGGFAIALDGLSGLSGPGRSIVHQFIKRYSRENYLIIGATSVPSEFEGVGASVAL